MTLELPMANVQELISSTTKLEGKKMNGGKNHCIFEEKKNKEHS